MSSDDSSDDEDVLLGTAMSDEEDDARRNPRERAFRAKDVEKQQRWTSQQTVHDEQGRQRLHGAFTGGWSAGYYNTVGSEEGWAPTEWRSSRSDRGTRAQQSVDDFMDEEDRAEARQGAVPVVARD
eukprot:3570376-Pleurochrysis_carterae.AAC.1